MTNTSDLIWKPQLKTEGPVPCPRRGHTMTQFINSSSFVLFGGESVDNELLNDMYIFDANENKWRRITYAPGAVPPPRYRHTTTAISTTAIIVIGGQTEESRRAPPEQHQPQQQQQQPSTHLSTSPATTTNNTNNTPSHPDSNSNNHNYNNNNADGSNRTNSNNLNSDTNSTHNANSVHTPKVDVWMFMLGQNSWAHIQSPPDDVNVPPARGGHSSVFIKVPNEVPGIYLYGGYNITSFNSIVYRLRTTDWRWDRITVLSKSLMSNQSIAVYDPLEFQNNEVKQLKKQNPNNANLNRKHKINCPCPRESHVALWLQSHHGMLIFGGETDEEFHSDFWLFKPTPKNSYKKPCWKWEKLNISMLANSVINNVPRLASASGLLLPSSSNTPLRLLLWAGMSSISTVNYLQHAWIVDLVDLKSFRVNVRNLNKTIGRVMHTLVRHENNLLLCGGVDTDSDPDFRIEVVELPTSFTRTRAQACDFGPLASNFARFGKAPPNDSLCASDLKLKKSGKMQAENMEKVSGESNNQETHTNLGPVPFEPGTKFEGKVEESGSFGTSVAVVIEGRLYKGILITRPGGKGDNEMMGKEKEEEKEKPKQIGEPAEQKSNGEVNNSVINADANTVNAHTNDNEQGQERNLNSSREKEQEKEKENVERGNSQVGSDTHHQVGNNVNGAVHSVQEAWKSDVHQGTTSEIVDKQTIDRGQPPNGDSDTAKDIGSRQDEIRPERPGTKPSDNKESGNGNLNERNTPWQGPDRPQAGYHENVNRNINSSNSHNLTPSNTQKSGLPPRPPPNNTRPVNNNNINSNALPLSTSNPPGYQQQGVDASAERVLQPTNTSTQPQPATNGRREDDGANGNDRQNSVSNSRGVEKVPGMGSSQGWPLVAKDMEQDRRKSMVETIGSSNAAGSSSAAAAASSSHRSGAPTATAAAAAAPAPAPSPAPAPESRRLSESDIKAESKKRRLEEIRNELMDADDLDLELKKRKATPKPKEEKKSLAPEDVITID